MSACQLSGHHFGADGNISPDRGCTARKFGTDINGPTDFGEPLILFSKSHQLLDGFPVKCGADVDGAQRTNPTLVIPGLFLWHHQQVTV